MRVAYSPPSIPTPSSKGEDSTSTVDQVASFHPPPPPLLLLLVVVLVAPQLLLRLSPTQGNKLVFWLARTKAGSGGTEEDLEVVGIKVVWEEERRSWGKLRHHRKEPWWTLGTTHTCSKRFGF